MNIKEVNKQAKIYAGRLLNLHIFCVTHIDYVHALHSHNASMGSVA